MTRPFVHVAASTRKVAATTSVVRADAKAERRNSRVLKAKYTCKKYHVSLMVKHIAFTAYPSNDVARTRRWYEEMLGLTFAGAYVEDGVEKYNEVHLGEGCFSLMSAEWTNRLPGSAASVYFEVEDLAALVASLEAKGVRIEDRFEGPVCFQASFSDPEGNRISIHESRPHPR